MMNGDIHFYLEKKGLLDKNLIAAARQKAAANRLSLCQYVLEEELISAQQLAQHFAVDFQLKIIDPILMNEETIVLIDQCSDLILKHLAIPIAIDNNIVMLGLVNPCDHEALAAFSIKLRRQLTPCIILGDNFLKITYSHIHLKIVLPEKTSNTQDNLVEFVNRLLDHAVRQRASDIHIEPFSENLRVRYRIDGVLHLVAHIPITLQQRIMSRLKVMANLNISEQRLPQDGHLSFFYKNTKIDCRINCCPVIHGEKAVIRILADKPLDINIYQLGLLLCQKKIILQELKRPQGLIIISGPTGSGKTVTLYSFLKLLNTMARNIICIEDPVEIPCEGMNQTSINPLIGLNFSNCLRALLRQDPDVIMIGEIRDHDTADIAIKAAQTGHLVLCTVHANSALEVVPRLISLGCHAHDLASTLTLIIAQRLVRRLCPYHSTNTSCTQCTAGFKGRVGVFECLVNDKKLREQLMTRQMICQPEKFISLSRAAQLLIKHRITVREEINRVIYNEEN